MELKNKKEATAKDYVYKSEIYYKHYKDRFHYPQWKQVLSMINGKSILEIGCGTGQFAHMACDSGKRYTGFDFSEKGIRICNDLKDKYDLNALFYIGDARDKSHFGNYDCYICLSTLEHIRDDKAVVSNIPKGKQFIFLVPNYNSSFHVRVYVYENEIRKRYSDLINIKKIIKPKKGFIVNSVRI